MHCIAASTLSIIVVFAAIGMNIAGIRQDSTVILAALAGSTLGFLRFNTYPAEVFMGDAGSLPTGGLLALIALACELELILAMVGGVFVVETVSVIAQVFWYRRTTRRLLLCSPLHNHYVFRGLKEISIVRGFRIVSVCCALTGLLLTLAL